MAILAVGPDAEFTTIQAAVNNARSGDEIHIAENVYTESVDLSQMGSAVGRGVGDLRLVGEGEGPVVRAPAGPAFRNSNTGGAFDGKVVFSNLVIQSPEVTSTGLSNGIHWTAAKGQLVVTDCVFSEIADTALAVNEFDGSVFVVNTEFRATGLSDEDAAIELLGVDGLIGISGNFFDNIQGTAIDLFVPTNVTTGSVIEANTISGDPTFANTTKDVLVAQIAGSADISVSDNHASDFGGVGIELIAQENARLQTRLVNNAFFNSYGEAVIRLNAVNSAEVAAAIVGNVSETSASIGISLAFEDSASADLIVRDNVSLNVGSGTNDAAIELKVDSIGAAVVHALIQANSLSDVGGNAIHVQSFGNATTNVAILDNYVSGPNLSGGDAAIVVENSDAATGTLQLQLIGNRLFELTGDGYRLAQRGTHTFRLAGSAATVDEAIRQANENGNVTVTGNVNLAAPSTQPPLPALLGDLTWSDLNGDATYQESSDGVLAYVQLTLTGVDVTNRPISRTTFSDSDGIYLFSALLPGEYDVAVVPPSGTGLVAAHQGSASEMDSDIDPLTRVTHVSFTGDDFSIDAGFGPSWQNPTHPLDVNHDTFVAPIDALLIINDLNANSARRLVMPPPPGSTPPYLDTNGDGFVAPVDVLLVINFINSRNAEAESGEPVARNRLWAEAANWWWEEESAPLVKMRR